MAGFVFLLSLVDSRRQVLKTQDVKSADPCQRQQWCFNTAGFISVKGTSLVLGLDDTSTEVDILSFNSCGIQFTQILCLLPGQI